MKRSLLISTLQLLTAAAIAQESRRVPHINKSPAGSSHASPVQPSGKAVKSSSKRTAHKASMHKEVPHSAPDQHRIDSIKEVQMRGKK